MTVFPSARQAWLRAGLACAAMGLAGCGAAGGGGPSSYDWMDSPRRLGVAGQGPVALRWHEQLTPSFTGPYVPLERAVPATDAAHDRVYVGTTHGDLYALTGGGQRLWRYDAQAGIEDEAAVDPTANELFVGTENGVVHALRASDGKLLWRQSVGGPIRRRLELTADAVYAVTDTDQVAALSKRTGEVLWTYHRDIPEGFSIDAHAGLTFAGGKCLTGFTDGTVVALDPADGHVVWERDTSVDVENLGQAPRFTDVDTTPLVVGHTVYVASFSAGLYALDLDNGSVRWKAPEQTAIIGLARAGSVMIASSASRGVMSIGLDDKQVRWVHSISRGAPSPAVVTSGAVLVGESQGSFLALDLGTGREVQRVDASHGFGASPGVAGRMGFVLSNGGELYAFAL